MRFLHRLFLIGFMIALTLAVRGTVLDSTATELTQLLRKELGSQWKVYYDAKHRWIEIQSVKSMLIRSPIMPSSSFDESRKGPRLSNFEFAFRVEAFVSPEAYVRRQKRNAEIGKKLETLWTELRQRGIPYAAKGSMFSPRTDAEKLEIERYNQLGASCETLPDFSFRNISLTWALPEYIRLTEDHVTDESARRECAVAIKKTLGLLKSYK
jgi:hypothetical protein